MHAFTTMGNHFHLLAEVPHRASWLHRFEGHDGEAKLLDLWHALAPRLWWKTVLKFEQ